jgi:predicted branched-subunit amino acid permease
MQGMAITGWAQLGFKQETIAPNDLLHYYKGFAATIYVFAISGTIIGFHLDNLIPEHVLRIVIFVTPLYLLLLIINAKQTTNKLAVVIGGTLCPLLYPLAGDWAILCAGFVGGTLSAFIIRFASLRADKERS